MLWKSMTALAGNVLSDHAAGGSTADDGVLDTVIDSAGIGMYFWNIAEGTLRWTRHHYDIFDIPASVLPTEELFRARIHPDDLAAVDGAIAAALQSGDDYRMRYRIRVADGAIRHVRGSGRFTYGTDGAAIAMNGAVIDVTQATLAENANLQREQELATIANNIPDLICTFDRACRLTFISAQIETLTGKPVAFFIGKTLAELIDDPVMYARLRAVLEDVMRHRHPREFDFTHTDRAGQDHFYITRALPTLDALGEVESVLTMSSDHTERERGARQVRVNGEVLRKADVRKNEYLATLAHELRGPLAPIASATQLIKLSNSRTIRDKALGVIERQVGNLSNLVNDLMEVGRISAGKLDIDSTPVTVQKIIELAVESTQPLLDAKRQQLTVHMPDQPLWLHGDVLRLSQVFINLITNASKYSPPAAPIAIDAVGTGGNAVINVRDSGIGLSATAMDDIFDLFVQVHATGVQAQGGLGIGLSLVRQLVKAHAGSVTVSSAGKDQGSCFTVNLPLADAAPHVDVPAAPVLAASNALRVLVVDDNVDGASTLATLLEALGHEAFTAFNGRDAVALAAQQPVDLAFIDLGLPDISGIQVALTIRGTPRGKSLPLVALTGLGRDEDRYMTQAAQFDEHIVKPLQLPELTRILATVARPQ